MYLADSNGVIKISDGDLEFRCPAAEFSDFEPEYPAIPDEFSVRYWDTSRHYLSDGQTARNDPAYSASRLAAWVAKIPIYQAAYDAAQHVVQYENIYVNLTFSGGDGLDTPAIYPEDPEDATLNALTISGVLLSDDTDETSVIDVSNVWRVPVFKVARERFAWETSFSPTIIGGFQQQIDIVSGVFTISDFSRTEDGVYMISSDGFELVDGSLLGYPGAFKVLIIGEYKFFKVILGNKIKKDK